ncbi:hypothetical protein NUU61_008100, partial [Penicillium alfredii]
ARLSRRGLSFRNCLAMGSPDETLYRTPEALPFELVQHSGIFFEEKLYTQALNLLLNALASGTIASNNAVVPLPQHLALAATFLVHPSTTTRARSAEEKEAANVALRLLRLTNTLIGPKGAKLGLAFSFTHFETSRHGGRRRAESPVSSELRNDETKPLNLDLSQSASLWSRAEDFWHVVGWAFNCSVLYPERWERWQIWLHFMCGVLKDDWDERCREYSIKKAQNPEPSPEPDPTDHASEKGQGKGAQAIKKDGLGIFRQSLIFRYLSTGGFGRNRRILRSIFADGGSAAVGEFREVFSKELRLPKGDRDAQNVKKREVEVNIDRDEYGDYLSQDGTDEETNTAHDANKGRSRSGSPSTAGPKTRRSKRTRRGTRTAPDPSTAANSTAETLDAEHRSSPHPGGSVSVLGGINSLTLRQWLLSILSNVSERLPKDFMSLDELYHLFVENIRRLSLPIFQAFVSPSVLPHFNAPSQTTLCEFLLFRMRESSAPDTDEEYLNQAKLEQCFLPFAAATANVVDNAKISILLESLIILLADSDMLVATPSLKEAVQTGILRRAEKAQEEIRRNQTSRNREPIEWCWLLESGERLIFLVEQLLPPASPVV